MYFDPPPPNCRCLATTSLQSLNLNKNRIEDEGAVILAKALAAGTSLRL